MSKKHAQAAEAASNAATPVSAQVDAEAAVATPLVAAGEPDVTEQAPHIVYADDLLPPPGAPFSVQSIEVSHAWRRGATAAQLLRLADAMELGRIGSLELPEDHCLDLQRRAFNDFGRAILGPDAPVMEVQS